MTKSDKKIDRNRHPQRAQHPGSVSVSLRSVQPVLMYISTQGYDANELLRREGVNPNLLGDPEARLPHTAAIRLWQAAGQLTNDPDLGLHVAEGVRPGQFGALEYALRTSANLGAAFTRLSAYHRILHDAAQVLLEVDREHAIVSHSLPLPGGAPRPISEFILAAWLITSRQAAGVDFALFEVRFPFPAPADIAEHRRVFGCPLKFEHLRSELVLARKLLDVPLLKADPVLQGIIEAQVLELLAKLPKAEATTDAVRRFLAEELSNGQPKLAKLAPRLRMSARTLHRRLEQEGTNFRRVLTEVRHELAVRHLVERRLAIGEIAFLLGFSEVSAFHRAFKHWTGHAPHAYRAMQHSFVKDASRDC
ncbi:MAG: AraC family transcriptional regulator [Candidatus Acidiferrum sp.]